MRRRTALLAIGAAAALVMATAGPASASPGDLDPSFSGDGQAYVQVSSFALDEAHSVALTSDGRVVMVGGAHAADEADFAVVRLKPDGFPDLTFSGDGRMTFSAGDDELQDVAVASNVLSGGTHLAIAAPSANIDGMSTAVTRSALTSYDGIRAGWSVAMIPVGAVQDADRPVNR